MLTTPTSASIVAGLQAQEGVKLLHGHSLAAGTSLYFNGQTNALSRLQLSPRADCYAHERLERLLELDAGVDDLTVNELLETAERILGEPATLQLNPEVVTHLRCPICQSVEPLYRSAEEVEPAHLVCSRCHADRLPHMVARVSLRSDWPNVPLRQIGVPPLQILMLRTSREVIGLELSADAGTAFSGWN